MLFRNETWAVKKEDVIRLEKEIRTEGRIFVEELKDRLKLSAIKGYLQNILLWFGHLERMNESYRMGNALAFQSISHRTGKRIKTHVMGKTWEIATHTFPIL